MRFVGRLEIDGSEFESAKELKFTLGSYNEEVVAGLDMGVATMLRGERAKFTIAPELGYGEEGVPPSLFCWIDG